MIHHPSQEVVIEGAIVIDTDCDGEAIEEMLCRRRAWLKTTYNAGTSVSRRGEDLDYQLHHIKSSDVSDTFQSNGRIDPKAACKFPTDIKLWHVSFLL